MTFPDRKQAPPFQLSKNYHLTLPEIFQLPGGQKLFAYRGLQQEAVKLELIYGAGKWFEPKTGVSHFTSQMLSKGTFQRNSFQVAEALDSLGAHLEINPGFDVVEISLFALRKNLLASLQVVREILERPSFDEGELRLMKDIFLQNLRINNEKTNVVASKEIRKSIFGVHHPYGGSVEEADVTFVEQGDLQAYFKDNFSLHSAFLIGHLSDKAVDVVIQSVPQSFLNKNQIKRHERIPGVSHTLSKQDSVQTSIRLGKKCIRKETNKEYFNSVMFNHILGGFFGSRLMKSIREEKGLTYGIYSSIHHFLHDSFWVIGAEVNQKNADQAVLEIKNEIKKLQEKPVSPDELEIARNYFIGSWQSENATLFAVAEKMKSLHLWNLPEDYYTKLLSQLQETTPQQVQDAANNHFTFSDLFEIRVG